MDFLLLITSPRFSNRNRAWRMCSLSTWQVCAIRSMSSMYTTRQILMDLRSSIAGLSSLVNTLGAVHRPNGRHLNWNIFSPILNRRRWRVWGAIGTMKKASFRSIFANQSSFCRNALTICQKTLHLEVFWYYIFVQILEVYYDGSLTPIFFWDHEHIGVEAPCHCGKFLDCSLL